jgi:hypothetical protein
MNRAAPNSFTGSGDSAFRQNHCCAIARNAPETSPCRRTVSLGHRMQLPMVICRLLLASVRRKPSINLNSARTRSSNRGSRACDFASIADFGFSFDDLDQPTLLCWKRSLSWGDSKIGRFASRIRPIRICRITSSAAGGHHDYGWVSNWAQERPDCCRRGRWFERRDQSVPGRLDGQLSELCARYGHRVTHRGVDLERERGIRGRAAGSEPTAARLARQLR